MTYGELSSNPDRPGTPSDAVTDPDRPVIPRDEASPDAVIVANLHESARAPSDAGGERKVRSTFAKLLAILTPRERKELALLIPAVIAMAIFDMLGVASIVPFLALLSNPEAIDRSTVLSWIYREFGFESHNMFFFAIGIGVTALLTLGNSLSALTTWALLRFAWMRSHSLSMRLLESYLKRPYSYFLTKNSSELSKNLLSEVNVVVQGVIVQIIQLGARIVVLLFVLLALLAMDPAMAIAVSAMFGGIYGGIYWAARRHLRESGKGRLRANQERFKITREALSGIKEVKLCGLEHTFLAHFCKPSVRAAEAQTSVAIAASLPKFALETVAFGGVLLMVLVMLRRGQSLADVLPSLGLYAFASYRLLPGLQTIFGALSLLRANTPSLDALVRDLDDISREQAESAPLNAVPPEPLPFESTIALSRVCYQYPSAERPALSAIDMCIRRGNWVALVGPTGSGKSTLIDIVLGLLRPSCGDVVVDERRLELDDLVAWQRNAGYVPQQIFLADDTVARNIAFGVPDSAINRARVELAATIAQAATFVTDELPQGYDTVIGEGGVRLSGGQRQRLGIARAIYRQPKLLVLDEATSALDSDTEERFFSALRSQHRDCVVISVAHRLTTTRNFDMIYVIDKGRIADAGTFDELRLRSPHFRSIRQAELTAGSRSEGGDTQLDEQH